MSRRELWGAHDSIMGCLGSRRQWRLAWVGCPNRWTVAHIIKVLVQTMWTRSWKQASFTAVTTSSFFHGYFNCKTKTIVLKLGLLTAAFVFILIQVILATFCCVGGPDLLRWCAKQHVCNKKLLLSHFSHFNKFYPFATDLIFFSKTEENLITPVAVSPFSFAAQLEFSALFN